MIKKHSDNIGIGNVFIKFIIEHTGSWEFEDRTGTTFYIGKNKTRFCNSQKIKIGDFLIIKNVKSLWASRFNSEEIYYTIEDFGTLYYIRREWL